MANIINQLATSNTFLQWLTGTQSLISTINTLREGGTGETFTANTNINIANNVTIGGNLTVSGNITLDAIGFDDLIVAGGATIGTTLEVAGNTTISGNATISGNTTLADVTMSNVFVSGFGFSANANVRPGVTTFSVTNSGSSAYLFDQYLGNNPDIYLHPGQTVSFNIDVSGHPFLIRKSAGGTLYNIGLTHVSTTGVVTTEADAQAKETGTLIWKVPSSLTNNTYVYQCQNHSGMVGNLIIQNTVSAAIAIANLAIITANSASGDGLAFAIALG
jgi:plastocyanin